MTPETGPCAYAFNEGSDARIAGKHISANPYLNDDQQRYWKMGWKHVNQWWGADNFLVQPLSEIMESIEC